ncbi:hypothetical protein OCS_01711 [Ophiocordyceps sinensis CO18]|uniref:Uncharacterized protein n=1 Tax=Ophiocordyceps sinensis (strain Co18 / CGMCC 3.14243) TaxID=911162 RepID=T5AL64_OPHSC|nr:hypothetical protein OCS_01711 [Ophiocordyceps sinensis CO18]
MAALLPDLQRTTNDLESQLKTQDSESKASRVILQTRRDALANLRYYFQEAGTKSVLIDWIKPGALCDLVETNKSAINILARANLVATLDYIQHVESKSDTDKRDFLQTLDASFPHLFQPLDLNPKPCPQLVLDIRTCYLIEMLACIKGKPHAPEAIARIFCQADGKFDYASPCEKGPYRRLGGDEEEDRQRCSAQIAKLLATIDKARKNFGLETLRQEFQLGELWGRLKRWIRDICDDLYQFEHSEFLPSKIVDDSDGSEDGSEDEAEEPVRIEGATAQQPFPIEAHSILELVATKRRDGANSPRDDDGQTSNGGLRQGSPVESGSGPSSRAPKRPYDAADDGEGPEADVEGEPDFQQDRRHLVHRTKVTALESWPTRVKFRRMAIGQSRLAMASENPSSALPNSSQQEVEKLERACKNPARKEHEVDAEGRPTNTVWLE